MPSEILNHGRVPPLYAPSMSSSFFSEEICFPDEKKVGFSKNDSSTDKHGIEVVLLASKSETVPSHYTKKAQLVGLDSVTGLESNHVAFVKEKRIGFSVDRHRVSSKETAHDLETQTNMFVQPGSLSPKGSSTKLNETYCKSGLFSSSLSELFNKQMTISSYALFGNSIDIDNANFREHDEAFESLEEIEAQTIGDLLPDDDDLLFGAIDDTDFTAQKYSNGDTEDDLFNSGGGMELDMDNISDEDKNFDLSNRGTHLCQQGELSSFAGEHPYGEHPSRTLFVRNISSNVEDAELTALFKQYGDIHTLYTACKHRGFVMVSYYDIRSARNAMEALQKKSLRRRMLDIHFSIPKNNPSDKDVNQGTLVVTNLNSLVSNDDLLQIFGVYGEVKEICETPHEHHKVVEFYDVRAAETALIALNRNEICGKQIKLETIRPWGAISSLIQKIHPELDHGEVSGYHQQGSSPIIHRSKTMMSPARNNGAKQGCQSQIASLLDDAFDGTSCNPLHNSSSASRSVSSCSNQSRNGEIGHSTGQGNSGFQNTLSFSPHSFPKLNDSFVCGIRNKCPSFMPATAIDIGRPAGVGNRNLSGVSGQSFEHNGGGFGSSRNGSCPLHGHQYLWNDSNPYAPGHGMWPNSRPFVNNSPCHPLSQPLALPRTSSSVINNVMHLPHYHVGSAPTVNHSPWETHHAYRGEMTGASIFCPGSFGNTGFSGSSMVHPLELSSNIFPCVGGNFIEPSLSPLHIGSPFQQKKCVFHGRNPMIPMHAVFDDRARGRRSDITSSYADNKKQYELDIERIISGEDARTTLMIKNIPNKYTSKMLLATIDEYHRGTYDFIYLPIDFKNKCNVGYAFINMIEPKQIIPFHKTFNGKKWEKFNSEKVASLAYARIQGKAALIAHFQNSSLMNEDKRCRPILFHSDGPHAGDQEPFPVGVNTRLRFGRSRTLHDEDGQQGSPLNSAAAEETVGMDSSSSPTKNFE